MDLELKRILFRPGGHLRVLMIGESPPPGRGFFYCGDSTLYRATQPVLCDLLAFPNDTDGFLAEFKAAGWFLEDISPLRGDKPHRRPGAPDVAKAVTRLSSVVNARQPTVVVGVLREIEPLLRSIVEGSEHAGTPWRCLRFPYHRSRAAASAYQDGLRDLISDFHLGPEGVSLHQEGP